MNEISHQRIEGAALLLASLIAYNELNGSWLMFGLLLLAFDVGMIGYIKNNKIGALTYNVMHSLYLPSVLFVVGIVTSTNLLLEIAAISVAHIGMDRVLGYGLKTNKGFTHTHLGRIGKH